MTLNGGTRVGPYEILSPLGAGGMGEVYRARDTRLGREVALKVLPVELALDRQRLRRFEQEARAASALSHSNIVTIYDVGEGPVPYIAMELVEGRTLRELLQSGRLPLKRLLEIGTQAAEGLARAHEAGLVHRDVKPENVMLSREGVTKLLDFGLAKRTFATGAKGSESTATLATEPGSVVGTVRYMSPEQAAGRPVDFRTDQFSLGSVLYEMASGRPAFSGDTNVDTLSAILHAEPERLESGRGGVPPPLRWIVERSLAKDPKDRYASTEDLARDLRAVREHLSEVSGIPERRPPAGRRAAFAMGIAAGLLAAAIAGTAWHFAHVDEHWRSPLAGARFTRFTDWEGSEVDAAISHDGKFVAFLSDRDGPFDAFVGLVGGGESHKVTRGDYPELFNEWVPSVGFSEDGAYVWIRVNSSNAGANDDWFLPTMGGVPRLFLRGGVSMAWSPDRSLLAYHTSANGDPIFLADRNGRNPRQLLIEKKGTHNHFPVWSPDGRYVYFVQWILAGNADIWRIAAAGGKTERITDHHTRVAYPAFVDGRTLVYCAARPDGLGLGLWGMDVDRRTPHLLSAGVEEYRSVAASADGQRLVATVANPVHNLWTVPIADRILDDTAATRVKLPTVRAAAPRYTPDSILYVSSKGGADGLWKFKNGSELELWKGSEGAVPFAPAVSPDGGRIAFVARGQRRGSLYVMADDGTGARRLAESLDIADAPTWSPDGRWIAAVASDGKTQPLFKVPVEGGEPLRLAEGVNSNPVWSPDGRFILYSEYEISSLCRLRGVEPDGKPFPLPEVRVRYQGNRYRFLPDGKSLVVMQGELWRQNFWLLELAGGRLRQLTNFGPRGLELANFDVSLDGKQILFDGYRENADVVLIDRPAR
jgi:Tol biopolymer transport system component